MCHSFLVRRLSVEKSADNLTAILSYVICCFSLVAFKVFSLIFVHLIMMCLGVFPPLVGPLWYSLHFLNLYDCFLFHVRGVFSCHLFNIFSSPISLFPFWDPYNVNVAAFGGVTVVSQMVLICFPLICFCGSGISSGVCPLVGLGPGACGILLGGRDWCLPTGGSWLSGGQGHAKGCV